MSGMQQAHITQRTDWAPGLVTLRLSRSSDFAPGQFFNLGLGLDDNVVRRSYSAASAPGQPLEFVLSQVAEGTLTPSLCQLQVGESVLVDEKPLGFFTLDEVPDCEHLWLVATGTGIGPYISMLRAEQLWNRFSRVSLVHGVRHEPQLCYRNELLALRTSRPQFQYCGLLSGTSQPTEEWSSDLLQGRITSAWDNGSLENSLGAFDEQSHMLLCGNPQMIEDMTTRLKERGFEKHRRKKAGHFNFEKYW